MFETKFKPINFTCGRVYKMIKVDIHDLDESLWQFKAIKEFSTRLTHQDFPCLFAKKVWELKSLRVLFCKKSKDREFADFFTEMLEYTRFVLETPLNERKLVPRIVFLMA